MAGLENACMALRNMRVQSILKKDARKISAGRQLFGSWKLLLKGQARQNPP